MNELERLQTQSEHWKQVRRDARKQLEYARIQCKKVQQQLAELALKATIDASDLT